jgi:hypothetical protein
MVRVSSVGWTAVMAIFSDKSKQEASVLISTQLIGELLLPENRAYQFIDEVY